MAIGKVRKSGIYRILNIVNGKFYYGSSVGLKGRIQWHLRDLREGKYHSYHLQMAWFLYGEEAFVFEVVEYCTRDECIEKEQYYLDTIRPWDPAIGYNISKVAGSRLGVKFTEEQRANLSRVKSAEHADPVFRAKVSRSMKDWWDAHPEARLNRPRHTEETKQLLSEFRKQLWANMTEEERAEAIRPLIEHEITDKKREKLRIAATGRKHPEETKAKISASNTGLKRSDEVRAEMSRTRKGRDTSAATAAAALVNTGKKRSPETKAKMSATRQELEDEKRAKRLEEQEGARLNLTPLPARKVDL